MMQSPTVSTGISEEMIDYCYQHVAWIEGTFESITVTGTHSACTFAHGRDSWDIGMPIRVQLQNRRTVHARIVAINQRLDVIWLQSAEPFCEKPPVTMLPSQGRSYFCIGHSGRQLTESPCVLFEGICSSNMITERGHVLGTSGAQSGDSGSPVFHKTTGFLMGMIVGAEMMNVVNEPVPHVAGVSRCYIVPVSSLLLPPSADQKF